MQLVSTTKNLLEILCGNEFHQGDRMSFGKEHAEPFTHKQLINTSIASEITVCIHLQ